MLSKQDINPQMTNGVGLRGTVYCVKEFAKAMALWQ
jgi:hypothetical protein